MYLGQRWQQQVQPWKEYQQVWKGIVLFSFCTPELCHSEGAPFETETCIAVRVSDDVVRDPSLSLRVTWLNETERHQQHINNLDPNERHQQTTDTVDQEIVT